MGRKNRRKEPNEITELRGGMIGQLNKLPMPERFVNLSAAESNKTTFLDTYTGRELTVGLCDAHGVRKALAAFFPDGRDQEI